MHRSPNHRRKKFKKNLTISDPPERDEDFEIGRLESLRNNKVHQEPKSVTPVPYLSTTEPRSRPKEMKRNNTTIASLSKLKLSFKKDKDKAPRESLKENVVKRVKKVEAIPPPRCPGLFRFFNGLILGRGFHLFGSCSLRTAKNSSVLITPPRA